MNRSFKPGLLALAFATAAGSASAATDVTAVTTEIAAAGAPIAAIGAAVLLVLVGIKVYKWVRRAM
ncbi:MAG: major capsid protein [Lysobacter sp.]